MLRLLSAFQPCATRQFIRLLTIGCFGLSIAGCGKSATREGFAEAYGTVTLDDKPLANAEVIFETEKGTSYGRTDSKGKYCAEYSRTLSGAGKGTARVRISTKVIFPDESLDELQYNTKTGEHIKPELVPPKYNANTELSVQITDDGAPYDFALVSEPAN